jgi:hypothetical protein
MPLLHDSGNQTLKTVVPEEKASHITIFLKTKIANQYTKIAWRASSLLEIRKAIPGLHQS